MTDSLPNSPWLTTEQAAEYCQLDIATIRKRVRDGEVRFTRVNDSPKGEFRFRAEWLDAMLESRAQGGEASAQ